jgi:AcrR family transcriptional regulator
MADALSPSLLAGAREVFWRHGFERATMAQIAEAAGTSRVTLHRRGVGKAELLSALAGQAVEEYRAAMWTALTSTAPAAERLGLAVDILLEQAERHMGVLVALGPRTDDVFHATAGEDGSADTRDVFTEPLERILTDLINEGADDVPDPGETATALFNIVGWSYIHLRTGHGWDAARAARVVRSTALHGVLGFGDISRVPRSRAERPG